ncbi:DUF3872 domain-containing protein [Chryseobacterium culicis]|uniref:Conjugal transfer protein TraQ n=2 Tax=Chryseobacterium culicis TaxID=680127 RepID=A0A1H6IGQ3_CHRCI|nr:protein of unknown function [Chryseobacterium culicis]
MKNLINIKKHFFAAMYLIATLFAVELCFSSCSEDELQVQKNFPFEVQVMPVSKYIANGETVEIRCRIIPVGNYSGTEYSFRYFQFEGKGILRLFNEPAFLPNDSYLLAEKEFRLYYTSESTVSQSFDIWISDNMGNEQKLTIQFNPQNAGTV